MFSVYDGVQTNMNRKYRYINQKFILILVSLILFFFYQKFFTKSSTIFIPRVRNNPKYTLRKNLTLKRISLAYYTTLYRKRVDSHEKIFNDNLKQICDIMDPENYQLADSVLVNLVDFVRFPILSNGMSYRSLHQSQLWIVNSEESPRNSYKTVDMKHITELDDWFNLTSTIKPESDFHIQYRVCFNEVLILELHRFANMKLEKRPNKQHLNTEYFISVTVPNSLVVGFLIFWLFDCL